MHGAAVDFAAGGVLPDRTGACPEDVLLYIYPFAGHGDDDDLEA